MFSGQNLSQLGEAGALGTMGGGLGELLGMGNYQNPADSAMKYMDQLPDYIKKFMGPYANAGMGALGNLQGQFGNMMNDPSGMLNKMGAGYQQSPGFKFALQQALQGSDHAAAAGGMAGSPQHEQQNMGIATQLGNQDYGNYMQRALGLFGQGLQGEQGIFNTGAQMSQGMGEDLASILAQQAGLAYQGQNAQNQQQGGMWGSLIGGGMSLLPYLGL